MSKLYVLSKEVLELRSSKSSPVLISNIHKIYLAKPEEVDLAKVINDKIDIEQLLRDGSSKNYPDEMAWYSLKEYSTTSLENTGARVITWEKEKAEPLSEDEALYNADHNCDHRVKSAPGGGIKCVKCPGWFSY